MGLMHRSGAALKRATRRRHSDVDHCLAEPMRPRRGTMCALTRAASRYWYFATSLTP